MKVKSRSSKKSFLITVFLVLAVVLFAGLYYTQSSQGASTFPALSGCSMAHCDQRMSDLELLTPPKSSIVSRWHDTSVVGSNYGIGCSGNGSRVVCSLINSSTNLVSYDVSGVKLWSSSILNNDAWKSAPIVDSQGGAVAADSTKVVRFDASGNVVWQTNTPGGIPISPNLTDDGVVVLATENGPISVYDLENGQFLGSLRLDATIDGRAGYFDTLNTPAISGNRTYFLGQFKDANTNELLSTGRLYGIDITRVNSTEVQITPVWYYEFKGPSGASPTMISDGTNNVVYFDVEGFNPSGSSNPHFVAVKDLGSSPSLLWQFKMGKRPEASAAQDPRGGLWVFESNGTPYLTRLSESTGQVLQSINIDSLVGVLGVHKPSSVMTITNTSSNPIMLVSATSLLPLTSYMTAIDLSTSKLVWKFRIDNGKGWNGVPFGQYPIVTDADGKPVMIFTTYGNGVWALGEGSSSGSSGGGRFKNSGR